MLNDSQTVKARKLVIASCGACGTPLSWKDLAWAIPKVLKAAGVPPIAELPGVGKGYEDHHMLLYPYLNSLDTTDTLDALVYGRMGSPEDLIKARHPMLGWNGQEGSGKPGQLMPKPPRSGPSSRRCGTGSSRITRSGPW